MAIQIVELTNQFYLCSVVLRTVDMCVIPEQEVELNSLCLL